MQLKRVPVWKVFRRTAMHFLELPLDIRLIVYQQLLKDHQVILQNQQPTNNHICLLHVCSQISLEADRIFRQYVSLRAERQMLAFSQVATRAQMAQIRYADVANDARTVENIVTHRVSEIICLLRGSISK